MNETEGVTQPAEYLCKHEEPSSDPGGWGHIKSEAPWLLPLIPLIPSLDTDEVSFSTFSSILSPLIHCTYQKESHFPKNVPAHRSLTQSSSQGSQVQGESQSPPPPDGSQGGNAEHPSCPDAISPAPWSLSLPMPSSCLQAPTNSIPLLATNIPSLEPHS